MRGEGDIRKVRARAGERAERDREGEIQSDLRVERESGEFERFGRDEVEKD